MANSPEKNNPLNLSVATLMIARMLPRADLKNLSDALDKGSPKTAVDNYAKKIIKNFTNVDKKNVDVVKRRVNVLNNFIDEIEKEKNLQSWFKQRIKKGNKVVTLNKFSFYLSIIFALSAATGLFLVFSFVMSPLLTLLAGVGLSVFYGLTGLAVVGKLMGWNGNNIINHLMEPMITFNISTYNIDRRGPDRFNDLSLLSFSSDISSKLKTTVQDEFPQNHAVKNINSTQSVKAVREGLKKQLVFLQKQLNSFEKEEKEKEKEKIQEEKTPTQHGLDKSQLTSIPFSKKISTNKGLINSSGSDEKTRPDNPHESKRGLKC